MSLLKINTEVSKKKRAILGILPFVVLSVVYLATAYTRHAENPDDKVVPTAYELVKGFNSTAIEEDRQGDLRLWVDTWASMRRFVISVAILFLGVYFGLYMGMFPLIEGILLKFTVFFDKVPALAVLPILFIIFGLGETAKIALIVIGVTPTIVLDTYMRVKAVQREQIVKGHTLGASDFEIAHRIVLPQIFPKVLETIKLNFKAVALFLIAGESIAATAGLGYRIFVVRRYMAMDIIIPYVLWMSMLLFLAYGIVSFWIRKRYAWQETNS